MVELKLYAVEEAYRTADEQFHAARAKSDSSFRVLQFFVIE